MAAKAARATKTKARTLAVVEVDDAADQVAAEDETKGIPLFEGLGDQVTIEVYRMEPIEEGTIGTLASDADEATIRRRWGGGVFKVTAKGTNGQFTRKQRTVTIGGDPLFESEDARHRYALKTGKASDGKAPAPAAGPHFGMTEILALVQASHQQSIQFMQAQAQAAQQAADQRAQAAQKLADDARQRDQQFLATMIGLIKADAKAAPPPADPMAMMTVLLKGLELGRDLGGDKTEGDPVTAFIQNLPQIIPQAQALLATGQQQAPAAPPAPPVPGNQQQPTGPRLILTGAIAEQLQRTVGVLQAKGYDAEKAMVIALQQLAQVPNAPTKADPKAPPAQPAPEPEASAANGTPAPSRATRRK